MKPVFVIAIRDGNAEMVKLLPERATLFDFKSGEGTTPFAMLVDFAAKATSDYTKTQRGLTGLCSPWCLSNSLARELGTSSPSRPAL